MSDGRERPEAKEDRERFYALLSKSKEPLATGEVMAALAILREALECGRPSMPLYSDIQKIVANMEALLGQEETLLKQLSIL